MDLQETNSPFLLRDSIRNLLSERLKFNRFVLKDATSIARLSFIVHYSICHLDLSVDETSQKIKGDHKPSCIKSSIITEEDCKKVMIPKRTLLYKLHLDVPRNLEMRLRKWRFHRCGILYDVNSFHLREIYSRDEFYLDILRQFLGECIKNSNKNVEVIRKYLKTIKKFFGDLLSFQPGLFFWILQTLYEECTDSQVIKEVLLTFNLTKWLLYCHCDPEILDFFLYHAQLSGYVVKEHYPSEEMINACIIYKRYKIVAVLLKYLNAPVFMETNFRCSTLSRPQRPTDNNQNSDLMSYSRGRPAREVQMGNQRKFLAFMVLDLFHNLPSDEGVQALRLLWRAIPDSFLTLNEWMLAFGSRIHPEILQQVDKFYSEIIEDETSPKRPRSLQQHCRITIRQSLYDCQKLPYGIEQLNLDSKSKAFLRLEI